MLFNNEFNEGIATKVYIFFPIINVNFFQTIQMHYINYLNKCFLNNEDFQTVIIINNEQNHTD